VIDEVDRLEELVADAQMLIEQAKQAQEAFRVGDVAGASQTMSELSSMLAEIQREVEALVDQLPPPSPSA
jgi:uncharacterized coiled-coil protein SlyX